MSLDHDQMGELLHAYVDGELDLVSAREVEQHLPACEECRRAEAQIRALRAALTRAAPAYQAPARLRRKVRAAVRREAKSEREISWLSLALAAGALGVLLLLAVTFFQSTHVRRSSVADQVIADHVRSLLASHLLDVVSSDQHTVKPWFHGKIDFAPAVIDLSKEGFPLIGGRLDYLDGKTAVALVYRRGKHPINLFIYPGAGNRNTKPELVTRRGYHLFHWTRDDMEYWSVSDLNQTELRQFVELVAR